MTIKKKPEQSQKADAYISKGGNVKSDKGTVKRTSVLINFPKELLDRIDEVIKEKPWLPRTSWILEAAFEKLEREKNQN
jgi:hypothetical protein